jgi:hypothetical protein
MAYQATILNVMIASPSDVAEERQLVREAIYEWNAIHSKQFGVMLNPIGWETHVAPEMGNRPQEIINKRILNDTDILIGIFWARLGTETGEYVSGTVEEITKHIASNKLTSIYICDRPLPPSQFTDQYLKLKNQIEKWKPSGVLHFYDDLINFKQSIKDHLSLQIQNNEYIKSLLTNNPTSPIRESFDTKTTIEPTEEMVDILINAGNSEDQILFRRFLGGQSLSVGELKLNLNKARVLAKWENALRELEELGLIRDRGYKGEIYELTNEGWKAFDQLKAQISEKE